MLTKFRPTKFGIRAATTAFLITALSSSVVAVPAFADPASPDSAPASEVTSGQRVTGHTRTHKAHSAKTSPEQPAPATAQKVPPSARLPDEPNQVKEQVAPVPDAPVKPGTRPAPGTDTPKSD
ncbi:hypothetical protein [Lichenicola sp.]|uniref:hypothetical protein n=1 Tax=Lichenicola sp. TaxID=2804529 RepID=UPI003B0052A0